MNRREWEVWGETFGGAVNAAPRLALLRCLAAYRDYESAHHAGDPHWPKYVPLFGVTEWPYPMDEMRLAAKESAAIGHIESRPWFAYETVRITDAGYDHIKAHDAIGEAEQELGGGNVRFP